MRIYDFETFEKYYKNIKAVKFKKAEEVPDYYYNKVFFGKKFKATYNCTFFGFINMNIYVDEVIASYVVTSFNFNNYIEYIEIENSLNLEIE